MSDDLSDLINNVKNMVDSGNIPDDIKNVLNNLNNNTSSSGNNQYNNPNNMQIDMDTILKMKKVIDNLNQSNDPRANLLYSLKPYLRDSKKGKLDQYVNLLNMTKLADLLNNQKEENNGNV